MTIRDKVSNIFNIIIVSIYAVLVGIILVNNIVNADDFYLFKKSFLLDNWILLLIDVAVIVLGYFIYRFVKINIWKYLIIILSIALFIAQLYIYYNILFVTYTWDAGRILKDAINYVHNNSLLIDVSYYSNFPNNVWTLTIMTLVVKLCALIGVTGFEERLFAIVILQSILSTLTGYLVYRATAHAGKSNNMGFVAWLIYVVLIGLSAQGVIPYSDMMAVVFPVTVFRIYQMLDNDRLVMLKWFMIGLISFIGYKVKPTVIIVLIAIVAYEILDMIIRTHKHTIKRVLKATVVLIAGLLVGVIVNIGVNMIVDIPKSDELNVGPLHMLMMGTNELTNGSFSPFDVMLSVNEANREKRTEMQKSIIEQRVNSRDPEDNVTFYLNKALMVFNDGTFAIGEEGGYYDIVFPGRDEDIAKPLREWYYNFGRNFDISSTIQQAVWMLVLLLNVLVIFSKRDKQTTVLAISLLGIIIFNMMFEARARYLLIFVPLFIVMAINNLGNVYARVKNIVSK